MSCCRNFHLGCLGVEFVHLSLPCCRIFLKFCHSIGFSTQVYSVEYFSQMYYTAEFSFLSYMTMINMNIWKSVLLVYCTKNVEYVFIHSIFFYLYTRKVFHHCWSPHSFCHVYLSLYLCHKVNVEWIYMKDKIVISTKIYIKRDSTKLDDMDYLTKSCLLWFTHYLFEMNWSNCLSSPLSTHIFGQFSTWRKESWNSKIISMSLLS